MENSTASTANNDNNLMESIMDVFDRTKSFSSHNSDEDAASENLSNAEDAETTVEDNSGKRERVNGAAEYAVYSKILPIKSRSPPPKPKRKSSKSSQPFSSGEGNGDDRTSGIGTELQEILESAFGNENATNGVTLDCSFDSPDRKVRDAAYPTPDHESYKLQIPNKEEEQSGTLTKSSVERQASKNESPNNCSFESKSIDSIAYIDGGDELLADDLDGTLRNGISTDRRTYSLDTISFSSVLSDVTDSGDWCVEDFANLEARRSESPSQNASRSSSPVNAKIRNKRKEKFRKKLVKAVAQKDKVGAMLDAAAGNATDHLKRMTRIKSVRLPGSRSRTLQQPSKVTHLHTNDQTDHNAATRSVDDSFKAKLNPVAENCKDLSSKDRQMAVKSGFLKKQSGGKLKTWNERWFVLRGDQLHYSKEEDGKPIAAIFLPGTRLVVHPVRTNDTNKYIFEIYPGNDGQKMNNNRESYLLSASSQADMEEWVKVIRRVMLSPFGGGIFGQRLDETLRYDRRLDSSGCGTTSTGRSGTSNSSGRRQAPIIVENCVEFIRGQGGLQEEGLFRLPGHANEVKELQDAYDNGERPVFPRTTDVHTVASLLKGYLRELPEPIIPFERYEVLIGAAKQALGENLANQAEKNMEALKAEETKMIKQQLNLLPQANFDLLRYLCRFLDEVQRHSTENKMDISNLAMVFGPNIMRSKRDDPQTMMSDASHVQHIMYQFIASHMFYFPEDLNTTPISALHPLPDVAMDAAGADRLVSDQVALADAGIGTLTSSASPLGTLAQQRNNTDDSGTGSLGPTPENTSRRLPPVPFVPSPLRNKPNKPLRRKYSGQSLNNKSGLTVDGVDHPQRKSLYDNVTASSNASSDAIPPHSQDRRSSSESSRSDRSSAISASTTQESYYVNNQTTPSAASCVSSYVTPRSSTNAVAGSVGTPEPYPSSPADVSQQTRGGSRSGEKRRSSRKGTRVNGCLSDDESNTESMLNEERAFSTLSSHRSSVDIGTCGHRARQRSSATSLLDQRKAAVEMLSAGNRLSTGSDVSSTSSLSGTPPVPSRPHRKIKRGGGAQIANSPRNSRAETDLTSMSAGHEANCDASNRSSQIASSTATSVFGSGQSLTYRELEEQVKVLQEELRKQRVEHEKRSRMLEEHYIMKMKNSSSAYSPFSTNMSVSGFPNPYSPNSVVSSDDFNKSMFRRSDDSIAESFDATPSTQSRRCGSIDSTTEVKYVEEVKKHAMTKIRLRNVERGLQQAEERNRQLQKEMEEFFQTFGSLMDRDAASS